VSNVKPECVEVGAVVRLKGCPKYDAVVIAAPTEDGFGWVRHLDRQFLDFALAGQREFLRWATADECRAAGVPYIPRDAEGRPEWVRIIKSFGLAFNDNEVYRAARWFDGKPSLVCQDGKECVVTASTWEPSPAPSPSVAEVDAGLRVEIGKVLIDAWPGPTEDAIAALIQRKVAEAVAPVQERAEKAERDRDEARAEVARVVASRSKAEDLVIAARKDAANERDDRLREVRRNTLRVWLKKPVGNMLPGWIDVRANDRRVEMVETGCLLADDQWSPTEPSAQPAPALLAENERLRKALVGHLFDGESVSYREALRSEMLVQASKEIDAHKAELERLRGVLLEARAWVGVTTRSTTVKQVSYALARIDEALKEPRA
jgi:hypothetical protein